MKKHNIIWIVTDSVRTYRTGHDDRDRLDIMDEIAKEGIEFSNAFTSAPSSILAASTMFTGLPACYISRHYNDFSFDNNEIDSLQNLLKSNGYNIYSIFDAKACRCALHSMTEALPSKYFPPKVTHDEWWPNKEITNILKHIFDNQFVKSPSLFLLWYNCRHDPNTSYEIERAIKIFKENGVYDDSILVMCSDHGYPDPKSGLTVETMKKYSHDMIITDDNIRVPLLIKYPGGPKGEEVDNVVRTSDIYYTLLDILDLSVINRNKMNYNCEYRGQSLIELLNGNRDRVEPRIARTDTRLRLSFGRVTSLRSDKFKYVYYCDEHKEGLYDMLNDPFEMENLIDSDELIHIDEIHQFRKLLSEMDQSINHYHLDQLKLNLQKEVKKRYTSINAGKVKRILIHTSILTPAPVLQYLIESLRYHFKNALIDFVGDPENKLKYQDEIFDNFYYLERSNDVNTMDKNVLENKYDVTVYFTENSRYLFIDPTVVNMLKKVNSSKMYMMDYNFSIYSNLFSKWVAPFIRLYKRNRQFYKGEPLLFFKEICSTIKAGIKLHYFKHKEQIFDSEQIKIMRDKNVAVFDDKNPFIFARSKDKGKRDAINLEYINKLTEINK